MSYLVPTERTRSLEYQLDLAKIFAALRKLGCISSSGRFSDTQIRYSGADDHRAPWALARPPVVVLCPIPSARG